MAIWCPWCKRKVTTARFANDRCPQCGKAVEPGDVLTKDPYQPKFGSKEKSAAPKKFLFDQKGGSDTDTSPDSIRSVNTESLGFIKRDK